MTYEDALSFWYGRINYEVRSAGPLDLKLERMRALLHRLGDPHDRLRLIHVTGTKGKGSTCAMIASVLRVAGYRVGLFTSPHLEHVEERIQVNGVPIARDELVARMEEVAPAVRAMETEAGLPSPTFFEIGTALGFLHFVRRRCEFAVLEVGLGGRFDSTNVCHPLVSVITNIGFDHTAQLGHTLEAIAFQKAGIIKPRVPVVSGVTQEGPREVIRAVAAEADAPLWEVGSPPSPKSHEEPTHPAPLPEVRKQARKNSGTPGEAEESLPAGPPLPSGRGAGGVGLDDAGKGDGEGGLPAGVAGLGLIGSHQLQNALVAVAAIDRLRDAGIPISAEAVARGLADVKWPARIEYVSTRPVVILDTAHNVPSAEALVHTLRASFPVTGTKRVVFAVSADKQFADILRILASYFDHFHLTKYGNNPRSVQPERLAETLADIAPGARFATHPSSSEAWRAARTAAGENDLVCVTGSVFLAGELRPLLVPEAGS